MFEQDLKRFEWTKFYEELANSLLRYHADKEKPPLIKAIHKISQTNDNVKKFLSDPLPDDPEALLSVICPFTVFSLFNRKSMSEAERQDIARALADILGVSQGVPESFNGVPVLNNQHRRFFDDYEDRKPDAIEMLWDMFEKAIQFADSEDSDIQIENQFLEAYDKTIKLPWVKWNFIAGLSWIRPGKFVSFDKKSKFYLDRQHNGDRKPPGAKDYLSILRAFEDDSLKELEEMTEGLIGSDQPLIASYSVESIIEDGCFLDSLKVEEILKRLKTKKNIILQGPPGTGKTWLAKRLAFALLGEKAIQRVKAVQFHPNLSYEDFVRGYRPSEGGKLELSDGPFLEMINNAIDDPDSSYVLVIEEINRGNPAQIFGEMLTLLEESKRTPDEALELCYRRDVNERVYIPDNLFVIGTMNIADRSLALVDFALRRRFAFIELAPKLGQTWVDWVHKKRGVSLPFLLNIQGRVERLNQQIANDKSLGHQFKIGHSYFVPNHTVDDERDWFIQIIDTEVGPLLEEYWFDDLDKATEAQSQLKAGL